MYRSRIGNRKERQMENISLLQDQSFISSSSNPFLLLEDIKFIFEINIGNTGNTATVSVASKAYIRGKLIAQAAKRRACKQNKTARHGN